MYEIRVTEAGREIHRQELDDGTYQLGRSADNAIHVANPNISRRHLQLELRSGTATVIDLGSTNGTSLNGRQLAPNSPTTWSMVQHLQIGALEVRIEQLEQQVEIPQASAGPSTPAPAGHLSAAIVSSQANPQMTILTNQAVLIGRSPSCAVRLAAPNVASVHCRAQKQNGRVQITNLDDIRPAQLNGQPLPVGQPHEWESGHMLQVGGASLHLTWTPYSAETLRHQAMPGGSAGRVRLTRYGLVVGGIAGLLMVCLVSLVIIAMGQPECDPFRPGCLLEIVGGEAETAVSEKGTGGPATPTLAPLATRIAIAQERVIDFDDSTPEPNVAPIDCSSPETESNPGWLDLPFPYGGTSDDFRRVSQRTRFGGRINSFFDHQYPIYPPRIASGLEPVEVGDTLVLYDGSESDDAFAQDANSGDYYSGHAGFDYAPENPRQATTPILAAAAGRVLIAKIDRDDNHMVWLEHDPDGDGRYQYATLYFHLHPDEHFDRMRSMEPGTPVEMGERIGTMGTTGRSTGIHLHFEVREDVNNNGRFSSLEKVDPYGFFPSDEHPVDPWSVPLNWSDSRGEGHEHRGIQSDYLWIHSLADEVVDPTGDCEGTASVQVDLYPVQGFSVINPGFTYIARNEQGAIVDVGLSHKRSFTILPVALQDVDPGTISLEFLDPDLNTYFTVDREDTELIPLGNGGFTFNANINRTGRYVLVAEETVDRVPPVTLIRLTGDRDPGDVNIFDGSVEITLEGRDEKGHLRSAIISTLYSLDCGQTWTPYSGPFTVTLATPHSCGESGTGEQGVEYGENDFILLAMSEDSNNNIEQPPSQAQFTIQ